MEEARCHPRWCRHASPEGDLDGRGVQPQIEHGAQVSFSDVLVSRGAGRCSGSPASAPLLVGRRGRGIPSLCAVQDLTRGALAIRSGHMRPWPRARRRPAVRLRLTLTASRARHRCRAARLSLRARAAVRGAERLPRPRPPGVPPSRPVRQASQRGAAALLVPPELVAGRGRGTGHQIKETAVRPASGDARVRPQAPGKRRPELVAVNAAGH